MNQRRRGTDVAPVGVNGPAIHSGDGAPSDTLGLSQDLYIDLTTGGLWRKNDGTWDLELVLGGVLTVNYGGGGGGAGTLTEVAVSGTGILVASGTGPIPTLSLDFGTVSGKVADGGSLATTEAARAAHASNTSNPHTTTKAQVGLGNVTNDAQWASTLSAQISALTAKTSVADADVLPIEDSAASNTKKKVAFSDLRTSLGIAAAFTPASLSPKHRWTAGTTVQSGGLVDTITDLGSGGKNMTAAGAARVATATDANGKTYLSFGGSGIYTAGVAADWAFLHNALATYTVFVVYADATPTAVATETILSSMNWSGSGTGMNIVHGFNTGHGFDFAIFGGTLNAGMSAGRLKSAYNTGAEVWAFTFHGPFRAAGGGSNNFGGFSSSPTWGTGTTLQAITLNCGGCQVGGNFSSGTFSTANPNGALTMGSMADGNVKLSGRIYEIMITPRACRPYEIQQYADWAAANYSVNLAAW